MLTAQGQTNQFGSNHVQLYMYFSVLVVLGSAQFLLATLDIKQSTRVADTRQQSSRNVRLGKS